MATPALHLTVVVDTAPFERAIARARADLLHLTHRSDRHGLPLAIAAAALAASPRKISRRRLLGLGWGRR